MKKRKLITVRDSGGIKKRQEKAEKADKMLRNRTEDVGVTAGAAWWWSKCGYRNSKNRKSCRTRRDDKKMDNKNCKTTYVATRTGLVFMFA